MKPSDRVEEIMGAWREDAEQGRRAEPSAIYEQHPEHAEELEKRFAAQALMDRYFAEADGLPMVVPDQIGDFRIVREVGRGGMGVVYEAIQASMRRPVALKVLYPTIATTVRTRKRFEREARITGRLHHTNVVTVYAMGRDQGYDYFAMELIEGQPLDAVIAHLRERDAGVPTSETLQGVAADLYGRGRYERIAALMAGVADALHVAHAHGVVHRDVKPSNLVLDDSGTLKLTDFGLAQLLGDEVGVTRTGEVLGTPLYMSPEQVKARREDVDHRTDVYSLGATLYEALSLQPPHDGEDVGSLCAQIMTEEPLPLRAILPDVPRDLATVIHKALSKRREDRYATAGEMAADLRAFAEGRTIVARPLGPIRRAWRRIRLRPVRAALVALLLLSLGLASILARDLGQTEEVLTEEQSRRQELEYAGLIQSAHRALRTAGPPWSDALELTMVGLFTRRPESGTAEESASSDLFSRAIALLPDRPEAYLERSLCWSRSHSEALADLDDARERGLGEGTYHLGRAYVHYQGDRIEEARAAEALCTTPIGALDAVSSFLRAALDVVSGDLSRCEELLARAIEGSPDTSTTGFLARRMRGLLRYKAGENHGAITDFLTAQQLGDHSFETAIRVANAWGKLGEKKRADALFGQLLEAAQKRGPDGYIFLALACSRCWSWDWSMWAAQAGIDQHGLYVPLVVCRAEGILRRGRADAALVDVDGALQALDEARPGEDWPLIRALRATILLNLDRDAEAEVEARRAYQARPRDFDVLCAFAASLSHTGQADEALRVCDALIDRFPLEHNGFELKGWAHGVRKEHDAAVDCYDQAIARWPEQAQLHRERAWHLWRMQHLDEAEAGFRRTIALKPDYLGARACLGGVLSEQNRLEEAEAVLREVLAKDGGFAPARGNLGGVLYRLKRYKEAEGHLRYAAEEEPGNVVHRETLGGVLMETGRPQEALEAMAAALELTQDAHYQARIHVHRSQAHESLRQMDAALKEAEMAVALAPELPRIQERHGFVLHLGGRHDEALAALDRAIALAEDKRDYQAARVNVLRRSGRPWTALEEGWALMEAGGGSPPLRTSILFRQAIRSDATEARYAQALKWAAALLKEKDPRLRPGALLTYGALALRAGKIDEARTSLNASAETGHVLVRVGVAAFMTLLHVQAGEAEDAERWLQRAQTAHAAQTRGRVDYEMLLGEVAERVAKMPR